MPLSSILNFEDYLIQVLHNVGDRSVRVSHDEEREEVSVLYQHLGNSTLVNRDRLPDQLRPALGLIREIAVILPPVTAVQQQLPGLSGLEFGHLDS